VAIRKPVLSVKEARSLAAHRSDLLPSVMPFDPLAFHARAQTEDIPATLATVTSAAEVPPLPVPGSDSSNQGEPVPVGARPQAIRLPEVQSTVSPGPEPVPAVFPVAIVAEAPQTTPRVSQEDTGLRRKAAEKKSRKAAPDTGPGIIKRQKPQVVAKRSEEGKMQVFLSASLPAKRVSKSFELLCRQYPPAKSLQMILRRAMDDYEVLLENGDLDNLPETYAEAAAPEVCGIIQTSRIMPIRLIERARAHFDPLGFESDRAFGRKFASAALAIFFEIQAQHQSPVLAAPPDPPRISG